MKNYIINSIISIFIKPRATIQQIVDKNPEDSVMLLACLAGISNVLNRAAIRSTGDTMELFEILFFALILGPFVGVISLYSVSFFIHWTGKWIGGTSSLENIRAAMAWASIPVVISVSLLIPQVILFGEELFTTETPILDTSQLLYNTLMIFFVIDIILAIWSFVLYLNCIGQVQGFSSLKMFGNLLLAGLAIIIPISFFMFLVV